MLNQIVKRALANKIAKGFPIDLFTDIENMHGELNELKTALPDERGAELADIIIYCCGIAGYLEIDLEDALLKKIDRIERRKITIDENGRFQKEENES